MGVYALLDAAGNPQGLAILSAEPTELALVNLVAGGQQPGGPTSSAYSTGPQGFAAWSQLLARHGHRVVKVRGPLADARLLSLIHI